MFGPWWETATAEGISLRKLRQGSRAMPLSHDLELDLRQLLAQCPASNKRLQTIRESVQRSLVRLKERKGLL